MTHYPIANRESSCEAGSAPRLLPSVTVIGRQAPLLETTAIGLAILALSLVALLDLGVPPEVLWWLVLITAVNRRTLMRRGLDVVLFARGAPRAVQCRTAPLRWLTMGDVR